MSTIDNFKSLPKSTRTLLSFGVILALVVALPLFIWAIITNQKFLISQKAQVLNGPKDIKVMVINFDPTLTTQNNQKLSAYEHWNTATDLESSYSAEIKSLSGNYANPQIVERVDVDGFPKKNDGFSYTENTYLNCIADHSTCHTPDQVDYLKILQDYQVCDKVNAGQIDELWIWGGPWFGYWEAVVAGPDAFNTNAPPITGSTCSRNLHIMGFNYERGLSEMLEDLGHRVEGTMRHVFTDKGRDIWTKYSAHSACGSVHIPPNGTSDYDWANQSQASSNCEAYLNYPVLTGAAETFNCSRWGCTGLGWKEYWLNHLPKVASNTNGTWDNWWKYVFDYDTAILPIPTETPTPTPTPTAPPVVCQFACVHGTQCVNGQCVAIATTTPTITPTPTPTGTPPPTVRPFIINFKFGGVDDDSAQNAKVTVRFKGGPTGNTVDYITPPLPVYYVANGIYKLIFGTLSTDLPLANNYTMSLKGEKHLAVKFCKPSGQTLRCSQTGDTGQIIIPDNLGNTVSLDFTGIPLDPGDLYQQDGAVDTSDFDKIKTLLSKPCADLTDQDKLIGDVDYNGCINSKDAFLVRKTLETRYDEN